MKIGEKIINELIKDRDVISATIVGSYSETNNLSKIGDLDIVVICKKLTKKIYFKLVTKIKKKKFIINTSINSTFGPTKLNEKNTLPIHLMIYDLDLHKEHVLKSPFTCYDWERSKIFRGISLKEIFPVEQLYLHDFFHSRRSSMEYLNDIKKNRISVRQYRFLGKKILFAKKYVKIDPRNRGEFVYHIINFLIINFYKFANKQNIKVRGINFDKLFLKITKNDKKLLEKFKIIKKRKKSKILYYNFETLKIGIKFIKYFENFLKKIKQDYVQLDFLRHAPTLLNKKDTFLGIRNNPGIKKIYKKKINAENYNFIITSNLIRSKMTARYFNSKKILTNQLINEIDYGKVDGLTVKQVKKTYPYLFKAWDKRIDIKFPNGENTNDVKIRAVKFINFLNKFKKGSKILIISHSFFLRVLLSILLKIEIKKAHKIKVEHLKILQFLKKGNKFNSNLNRFDKLNLLEKIND